MDTSVPVGLCQCGCGQKTAQVQWNRTAKGMKKGDYYKYVKGHGRRQPLQVMYQHKKCAYCQEIKPLTEYDKESRQAHDDYVVYRTYCKGCSRTGVKGYDITFEQYESMLEAQGNSCRICKTSLTEREAHIDHDHVTGKVRGILCPMCNKALGGFGDSLENLQEAVRYLTEFGREAP